MQITLCFPETKPALAWQTDLREALPQSDVTIWQGSGTDAVADYGVVWQAPQLFFDTQPQLKALFNAGAGVDGLLKLRLPADIPLIRLEDAGMGLQMAQYVSHAVLHHFRGFDRYAAQAARGEWRPHAPRNPDDYPIGIMGYGILGQAIAQALAGLGFTVHAWTRTPHPKSSIPVFSGADQLTAFLNRSKVLVCALPLTPATRHTVNADALAKLLPDAYFINIARGGLVNEANLLAALDQGRLAGAALDVCDTEPAGPDHPFWRHPKVRLTPHISAITLRQAAIAQIVSKIKALEAGQAISGIVDLTRSY